MTPRQPDPADPQEQVEDLPFAPDDELELDDDGGELASRLRSLFDPSADLHDRTAMDVDRTLRGRSVLATGFDLLGLGVWTVRALLSDAPSPADQDSEGI